MGIAEQEVRKEKNQRTPFFAVGGSLAAVAGVVIAVGHCTKLNIPADHIGLSESGNTLNVVPEGKHWFGKLRYPKANIVQPGENRIQQIEMTLTPGTLDKLAMYGRKSLLVNLLPVAGDYIRDKLTSHVKVRIQVDYDLPTDPQQFSPLLVYTGSADFENEGVARMCYRAILPEEEAMGRRFFAPKEETLEALIKASLSERLNLKVNGVQIVKVEKFQVDAKDIAAEYRALRADEYIKYVPKNN